MKKQLLFFFVAASFIRVVVAQDIMLQGWYWDYPKTTQGKYWCDTLALQSKQLHDAGFNYIWLPPMSRAAAGNGSNGYDVYDYFDLGHGPFPSSFGNRDRIDKLIDSLDKYDIVPVADMIYNHRVGGKWENNGAVEGWIENYNLTKHNNGDVCYPSDRYRCILPIGSNTGLGTGTYYFKIHSASLSGDYYSKPYTLRINTKKVTYNPGGNITEAEPNGGADCGQGNNTIQLGRDVKATIDNGGCGTDEFALTISSDDYYSTGDTMYITLVNDNGNYSDHFIYGLWYTGTNSDKQSNIKYQTATNFNATLDGRGKMNYLDFKPNGNPTCLCGDWDGMLFFYDVDQYVQHAIDTLQVWTKWMMQDVGAGGLRLDAVKNFTPEFTGNMLDYLHDQGLNPKMVVGESYDYDAGTLKTRLDDVYSYMDEDTKNAMYYSLFDFNLQSCLRDACDAFGYDARNVFSCGMHASQQIYKKNIVTFVNNHDFRDSSQATDVDRILAYAYTLTNPTVGIPCVYWRDYKSPDHPAYFNDINQLMRTNLDFIRDAPNVDYISRFSTPYSLNFISGGGSTTLLYQLCGATGPCLPDRDVLVAINFSGETLMVNAGVNTSSPYHLAPGDTLTDLLGRSNFDYTVVSSNSQVYLEVPGRSYSVWARVSPAQPVVISAGGNLTFCKGDSVILSFVNMKPCYTYQWSKDGVNIPGATGTQLVVKESGNYVVYSGYSLAPLAASNSIIVTVNPEHPVATISGNTISCSVSAVSYQWYEGSTPNNLVLVNGATMQTYDPPHGNYFAVQITDGNGCSDISDPVLFNPVGVDEVHGVREVELFPNPATVELQVVLPGEISRIEVSNLVNQKVSSVSYNRFSDMNLQLNVADLKPGTYFIHIYFTDEVITKKFVKQ
ncbi:MAG: T9SS type A sorting domain-containing protein [Chitinophagales bacterium]|nr:T9SS type A sorting domain-containing protein [Chitinophagales bacterium]